MGGVSDALFGKPSEQSSHSESHSSNLAYPAISGALTPALGYTTQGGSMIANLLGLSGGPAQTAGLENFANSGGMDFLREQGNKQITSNQASKGLLDSGDTLKAEEKYGQGLGSTYLNQYMQNLMGFSNLGLGAANAMSGAGNVSNSVSDSKGTGSKQGVLGDLIAAAPAIAKAASDPRLKINIVHLSDLENGLGLYEYDYVKGYGLPKGRQRGVMADEVLALYPDAYIPNFIGKFAGVDYGKLN